jgi:hypothetical protein
MAGFDPHRLDGGLVVDVQSDLIDVLDTRGRGPPAGRRRARAGGAAEPGRPSAGRIRRALPPVHCHGAPRRPRPPIGSLGHERDRIRAALDMLFLGF